MSKLNPIPTPWHVHWSAFRRFGAPILVLSAVIALLASQWSKLDGGGFPGIAEGVRSAVTCPQAAFVRKLAVEPYQWVQAGQVVATVEGVDPTAGRDLLQSELQIARLRLEPSLADQNAMDFERLRVESLRLREELAVSEVELKRTETVLRRDAALHGQGLISQEAYDLSLADRDARQAETLEKRKSIKAIEARLTALRPFGEPELPGNNHPARTMVAQLDTKLLAAQTNWCTIALQAPISGMVQIVNRQPGEFVPEGEALLTINSARADRIVGYLRQPYVLEPELGMKVEVVTRSRQRRRFLAEITHVGAQVEPITNALAVVRPFTIVDVGLPVVIRLPADLNVRPGELFDIIPCRAASNVRGEVAPDRHAASVLSSSP